MELLEPKASQLVTRPKKDRQEKPVDPRRTLVVVEDHGVVVVGGGDPKARSLLSPSARHVVMNNRTWVVL